MNAIQTLLSQSVVVNSKGKGLSMFSSAKWILMGLSWWTWFLLPPVHADEPHADVEITFHRSFTGQTPVEWVNPHLGKEIHHPALLSYMFDDSTVLSFSFTSNTTSGNLVILIKNKPGEEWDDGTPAPTGTGSAPLQTYQEYMRVTIPLSQSGVVHTLPIGNHIDASGIGWGDRVYLGFYTESGNDSSTEAFCNDVKVGSPWTFPYLVSPKFNLAVHFDTGLHPDTPAASISEETEISHGFTDMGVNLGNYVVHGAISQYTYALKDASTAPTGSPLALDSRIWELYSIDNSNLIWLETLPGEGEAGAQCRFQAPENTGNTGERYLVLCRTVDALGHANMDRPTTTADPGLGNNAYVFEVGKDVTKDPGNCLGISPYPLVGGGSYPPLPECDITKAPTGHVYLMPTIENPNAQDSFIIRWRGRVSNLTSLVETTLQPTPPEEPEDIFAWPSIVTDQSNMPIWVEWQYRNAYGLTAFSAAHGIAWEEPSPPPFQAKLEEVDWVNLPANTGAGAPFTIQYQVNQPEIGDVVMATAWIYAIENGMVQEWQILEDDTGERCFQLIPGSNPQSLELVLPDNIESWNLDAGAEIKVRLKAEWRPYQDCAVNFLNNFAQVPSVTTHQAMAETSSWLISGAEPGHFTGLFTNPPMAQVNATTGDVDLEFQETHSGEPDPELGWRWEMNVNGNDYLWIAGQWQQASNFPDTWIEIGTGHYGAAQPDIFSSRWQWLRGAGRIEPKGRSISGILPPLAGTLVDSFFTPPNETTPLDQVDVTVRVRMGFGGRHETLQVNNLSLSLLQPEPEILDFQFQIAAEGQTPGCGTDAHWLDAEELIGRLGDLPRMQFYLKTAGSQPTPITLRIEKLPANGETCHNLDGSFFATGCSNTPGLGEDLERWWVADAGSNLFNQIATSGPGSYRLMFTTESCGNQANSTAAVTFTLNPDQSFALRIHYRDHIGSSGISRVYKPSPGSAGNAAPLNLAVSGQNVVLYASQPEWTFYEPFGKLWDNANSEPDPRYTDHEYDMQTGYNYMKGRYQLPNCGRFNRPDPMRDWDWENPASINLYQYVRNSPIEGWDPFGLITKALLGKHTEKNAFGHFAISINGTVYSYGSYYVSKKGDWGVDEQKYLDAQNNKRQTEILILDISEDQEKALEESLKSLNSDPRQDYDVLEQSCVTCSEGALEDAGILPNEVGPVEVDQAGNLIQAAAPKSLTPDGLGNQIKENNLVKSSETVGTAKVSRFRSFINTAKGFLKRLFNNERTVPVPPAQ